MTVESRVPLFTGRKTRPKIPKKISFRLAARLKRKLMSAAPRNRAQRQQES
jgi:hypothetical protein